MHHSQISVAILVDRIARGEIRLPEIQREYVWKGPQVATLLDSLYREYPSGSLLLWETGEEVSERDAAIEHQEPPVVLRPQYLIDGQQRATSLHRVLRGHPDVKVVFNVHTERFQMRSATTGPEQGWVDVHALLSGKTKQQAALKQMLGHAPDADEELIGERLERLRRIGDYVYQVEVIEHLPYEEVTEIFVRVNSKGKPLKSTDLALATLSVRWKGVVDRVKDATDKLAKDGFGDLDSGFVVRALAGVASEAGTMAAVVKLSVPELEAGWKRLERGIEHTMALLRNNVGINSSKLVTSVTALIPIVALLGRRADKPLSTDDANGIVYWLFGANLALRYSAGKETRLGEDLAAARAPEPVKALLTRLGVMRRPIRIASEEMEGKGVSSPYFALTYLASRRAGAKDWFHGVDISIGGEGRFALEYHHVHPRATLRGKYDKSAINDLANLAFISGKANRKISNRSPADYFPELGDDELSAHFVPPSPDLRSVDAFGEFLVQRRGLLAAGINDLLKSFQPSYVTGAGAPLSPADASASFTLMYVDDPTTGERIHVPLLVKVKRGSEQATTMLVYPQLRDALDDVENGLSPTVTVGHNEVDVRDPASSDLFAIAVGPLRIVGTITEWRRVLERELSEAEPDREGFFQGVDFALKPSVKPIDFWVLDTE